ncbi:antibiotic biosynthesis monooxygenase [Phormidium tenue FACHB-886]|nr:antibiotic biosynthesis monooxygenase [Phormidium tenue FACHB-886]
MTNLINPDVATFINVFTVEPTRQAILVHRIKSDAENTISRQPGFIRAIVYRSLDGSRVINVVQWESVEASRAIHRNPDITAGFASYQELGVEMDLRYYETVLTEGQPLTIQNHEASMVQVNVLHVAPENQQRLLEQLIQKATPAIASQAENQSVIWLRSHDGTRAIRFLCSHNGNDDRNKLNSVQVTVIKKWIAQIDTNHYQIECVVAKQSLLI